jgi:hypothetical protein
VGIDWKGSKISVLAFHRYMMEFWKYVVSSIALATAKYVSLPMTNALKSKQLVVGTSCAGARHTLKQAPVSVSRRRHTIPALPLPVGFEKSDNRELEMMPNAPAGAGTHSNAIRKVH